LSARTVITLGISFGTSERDSEEGTSRNDSVAEIYNLVNTHHKKLLVLRAKRFRRSRRNRIQRSLCTRIVRMALDVSLRTLTVPSHVEDAARRIISANRRTREHRTCFLSHRPTLN